MQKGSEQLLLITSYNGVYQEDYKIPIHSLWHAVEVLPQPSYVTSSCKSAIIDMMALRITLCQLKLILLPMIYRLTSAIACMEVCPTYSA